MDKIKQYLKKYKIHSIHTDNLNEETMNYLK